MSTLTKRCPISGEEYLEDERHDSERNEFVGGEIYAMVGVTQAHNMIVGNCFAELHGHLRESMCRVFTGTMKLRVGDDFYYPDVLVTCRRADKDPRYVAAPVPLVEVMSPGTVTWDTRHKLAAYKPIGTLREYVLAEQDRREIRVHRRSGKTWRTDVYTGTQSLRLSSVDLTPPLGDIHQGVLPA